MSRLARITALVALARSAGAAFHVPRECAVGAAGASTDCTLPGACDCLRACEREHMLYSLAPYCHNVSGPAHSWDALLAAPVTAYAWERPLPMLAPNVMETAVQARIPPEDERAADPGACSGHGYRVGGRCACFLGYSGAACQEDRFPPACQGPCEACRLDDGVCERRPAATATASPAVYVYDLPPGFGAWRGSSSWGEDDLALYFWRRLGASAHITTDPAQADLFFVPVTPFSGAEMSHGALLLALRHVAEAHPWFNASGGADHLLACPWDFGCTWIAGYPGVGRTRFLTHWGVNATDARYSGDCPTCAPPYVAGKDVVVPDMKERPYKRAPPSGAPRATLLFFWGLPTSALRAAALNQSWATAPGVLVGGGTIRDLAAEMDAARFCLTLPGAGYTTRGSLAVTRGCIPVLVGDNITQPLEEVFTYDDFSVRVPEARLANLLELLAEVTPEREAAMRARLAEVAPSMVWDETSAEDAFTATMRALGRVIKAQSV